MNKVALVTGGNKGIGKEIVRGLAKQGFTVLLGARKPDLGEAAAAELAKDGQVVFQQLDVTDVNSVKLAAAAVKQKYGYLCSGKNRLAVVTVNLIALTCSIAGIMVMCFHVTLACMLEIRQLHCHVVIK